MKPNTLFAALSALLLSMSVAAAPASAEASLPDFDPTHVVADDAVDSADAAALRDSLPETVSTLGPTGDVADAGATSDAPEAIWLTTNKGCNATFAVGEGIRASWSVSQNDYYRLSIVTDQGTSYPQGAYWYLYQAGGGYSVDATVAAGPEVRTIRLEGWYSGDVQTCAYNVGAAGMGGVAGAQHAYSYVTIRNLNSGKCVEVQGRGTNDGRNILQYHCNGTSAQDFYMEPRSAGEPVYRFKNLNSGKCIEVQGNGSDNGRNILQYTCNGTPAQWWRLDELAVGEFQLVHVGSGKCMDVDTSSLLAGANIRLWSCNRTGAQRFSID